MREKKLYEIGQTCFFDPGPPPTALNDQPLGRINIGFIFTTFGICS